MIKDAKFHHIAVKATDFDVSYKFYTEGLGLKPVINWGEGDTRAVMLDIGDGGCIELFAGGIAGEKGEEKAGDWIHFAIQTSDSAGAFDAAIEAGAVCHKAPFEVDIQSNPVTSVKIAFVKGPDGEIIEFFEYRR